MFMLSYIHNLLLLQYLPAIISIAVVIAAVAVIVLNYFIINHARKGVESTQNIHDMMEKALDITENNVILFDVKNRYVTELSGNMLPEEGVDVATFLEHVHPDDRETVRNGILNLERGEQLVSEFYYHWNFDYTGKEPKWRYLHNSSVAEYAEGIMLPVSIISNVADETELHNQQEEEEQLSLRYKQIFENSIIGLSFYSPDGWLIDVNRKMREICHFDNDESDEFFSKSNIFDLAPFSEVIDRKEMNEYWGCSQSVIPERNMCVYLEIRFHPMYDENHNLAYLAVAARDITEERELYRQQKLNEEQLKKANDAITVYETELRYMMENCKMQAWRISFERDCVEFYNGLSTISKSFKIADLSDLFIDRDHEFVRSLANPREAFSKPRIYLGQAHPMVTKANSGLQWVQFNSIPEYDDHGNYIGAFGVWRNVNDLMRKQEQLKKETERANDSGRQKSVFLANMTHEIRTPLNAIVGFSDLLQAIDAPEEKTEMIRIIHNNCDMLLRLINDILVLSNVDANAMQIQYEEVDFAMEFADICTSLAERVQEPSVEFQSDNPCDSLLVHIDKNRIQQVITNFVTNAVKYTHQGHIRVGYRTEEREGRNGIYVYCEDTGAGIPHDQLERVFERFVKLNDYIQGTGLGLSICKAIIEKCEGQIGVDSDFGKGSTFWFWIPV